MKHVLIHNGSSTALKAYLETGRGVGLWSYHQSLGLFVSNRELTPAEVAATIAVAGAHAVIPTSQVTNSLA